MKIQCALCFDESHLCKPFTYQLQTQSLLKTEKLIPSKSETFKPSVNKKTELSDEWTTVEQLPEEDLRLMRLLCSTSPASSPCSANMDRNVQMN